MRSTDCYRPISFYIGSDFRDWSLITGRGGGLQNERGACEVLPQRKGGGKSFRHAEGGGTKSFEVVLIRECFSHSDGGAQKESTL